jgi:hypothetical protein
MGWHGVGFSFSYFSQALEGGYHGDSFGSRQLGRTFKQVSPD